MTRSNNLRLPWPDELQGLTAWNPRSPLVHETAKSLNAFEAPARIILRDRTVISACLEIDPDDPPVLGLSALSIRLDEKRLWISLSPVEVMRVADFYAWDPDLLSANHTPAGPSF